MVRGSTRAHEWHGARKSRTVDDAGSSWCRRAAQQACDAHPGGRGGRSLEPANREPAGERRYEPARPDASASRTWRRAAGRVPGVALGYRVTEGDQQMLYAHKRLLDTYVVAVTVATEDARVRPFVRRRHALADRARRPGAATRLGARARHDGAAADRRAVVSNRAIDTHTRPAGEAGCAPEQHVSKARRDRPHRGEPLRKPQKSRCGDRSTCLVNVTPRAARGRTRPELPRAGWLNT